jgi:hypothetical protein
MTYPYHFRHDINDLSCSSFTNPSNLRCIVDQNIFSNNALPSILCDTVPRLTKNVLKGMWGYHTPHFSCGLHMSHQEDLGSGRWHGSWALDLTTEREFPSFSGNHQGNRGLISFLDLSNPATLNVVLPRDVRPHEGAFFSQETPTA